MGFYVLFYFSEDMTDNYRKIINVVIMTSFGFIILVFSSFHIFGILGAVATSSSGGVNLYEGTLFQVLYPSNWIKEDIPLVRYTALESTPLATRSFYERLESQNKSISTFQGEAESGL